MSKRNENYWSVPNVVTQKDVDEANVSLAKTEKFARIMYWMRLVVVLLLLAAFFYMVG